MENRIFNVKDFEKEDKDIAVKTLICNTDASSHGCLGSKTRPVSKMPYA